MKVLITALIFGIVITAFEAQGYNKSPLENDQFGVFSVYCHLQEDARRAMPIAAKSDNAEAWEEFILTTDNSCIDVIVFYHAGVLVFPIKGKVLHIIDRKMYGDIMVEFVLIADEEGKMYYSWSLRVLTSA